MNTAVDSRDRFVPVLVVAIATTTMGAFAGRFFGGPVLVATFGLIWGLALAALAAAVTRNPRWTPRVADAALLLAGLVAGVLFGFGLLDLSLHSRLMAHSPQNIGTLIQPPLGDVFVVGLIALNTSLEWLLLPAAILLSWRTPTRRTLVLGAAALYYAMRVWSYVYFVPLIFDWGAVPAGQPYSAEQLEQIRLWVQLSWIRGAVDGLMFLMFLLFLLALLVPAHRSPRPHQLLDRSWPHPLITGPSGPTDTTTSAAPRIKGKQDPPALGWR